jgi:hypothetical protein
VAVFCWAALAGTPVFAECDTTAPTLTGFTFSPPFIDTTAASQTVTCNMTLTDALPGVANATCAFTSPADPLIRQSCTANAPTSGTPQNGTWSCVVTLPRYSQGGPWNASVSASDAVGNLASGGEIDPGDLGFSSTLAVIDTDPDITPPALTSVSTTPVSGDIVRYSLRVTDAKSGVARVSVKLTAPDSTQSASCSSSFPDPDFGRFECTVSFPSNADEGLWTSSFSAVDTVGNVAQFAQSGTWYVSSTPEDLVAPSLVLATTDFNPHTINVGANSTAVVCTMAVADSPAGVSRATCSFNASGILPDPPFDSYNQTRSCTATSPTTGTPFNGTFVCTILFPRYSGGGSWTGSVTLTDYAQNSSETGLATPLTVDCGAASPETPPLLAADKTTLSWGTVAGATQYNVYRGPGTNLYDTNADHLPEGGYGECQNSRDPNITDTSFVDTDVPTVAQKGFFYLVSYKEGGVEQGLGTNSLGLPRTVAAPCP